MRVSTAHVTRKGERDLQDSNARLGRIGKHQALTEIHED